MLGPEAAILRPKTAVSFILALFSAVAHSSWNLLLKRAGDSEVFAWCLLVAASILLTPVELALL